MYMATAMSFSVPPDAVLDVCLCHSVRRTARAVSRLYDAALAPVGPWPVPGSGRAAGMY